MGYIFVWRIVNNVVNIMFEFYFKFFEDFIIEVIECKWLIVLIVDDFIFIYIKNDFRKINFLK